MEKLYNNDVNISVLIAQMEILQVLLKDGDYFCFDDIIVKIKELTNPEWEMIKEVITLSRFSNLTVLNIQRTDRLSTIAIANEFTDRNTNRKRNFGTF